MRGEEEEKKILLALLVGMSTIFISSMTGSGFLDILIRIMFVFLLAMTALLMQTDDDGADHAHENAIVI
jgi:hypothetical protein